MNKKISVILVTLLLLAGLGSSAIVSNSEDWRDTSLAIAYGSFQDENVHTVTGYSEALVVSEMLSKNASHTVFESPKPVWRNYEQKLENSGMSDVSTRTFNWEQDQYDLYSDVSDEVKGFVVIKPGYGIDTISIFPKIISADYWPVYYQGEKTEKFLKRQDKPVIFYGEFLKQPWKKLDMNETLVAEGSKEANNYVFTQRLLEQTNTDTMVVAGDSYIEEEFIGRGDPILVNPSVQEATNIIETSGVSYVQVIGAENVGFGTDLENTADNITVVAKFGRRFTGVDGLKSTYPIKKIPVKPVIRDVSVEKVQYNGENSVVEVVFNNKGTIPTNVDLSAVSLEGTDQTEVVSRSVSLKIRPGENTTVDFGSNVSFDPETAGVSYSYEGSGDISNNRYAVTGVEDTSVSDLELKDFYYLEPREQIVMNIQNVGENDVWVSSQLKDLQIMNRSVNALSEKKVRIPAGSSKKLKVDTYLTEQQVSQNSQLDVAVTYGESKNFSKDYEQFSNVQISVKETTLIGTVTTYGIPVIILLIIILLYLYYRRRKKMKKELRGLR